MQMTPKQIHVIRHAQGFHNLGVEYHALRDPLLTPQGKKQCCDLSKSFPNIDDIDLIVSSPIRRALYTALYTFKDLLRTNPKLTILALPELQETSSLPCDVGVSRQELEEEFKQCPIDFSHVQDDWNNKTSGPFAPNTDLIADRVLKVRRFLRARKEREVVVVSHGCLLHYLTEDWAGSMDGCGTGWSNCELRTYAFANTSDVTRSKALIRETRASLMRRRYGWRLLTQIEQDQMRVRAEELWNKDGYILLVDGTVKEKDPRSILTGREDKGIVNAKNLPSLAGELNKRRIKSLL